MRVTKDAPRAAHAWPKHEPVGVQVVEVLPDHREQPPEVPLVAGRVTMKIDLRHLGLHQAADFQARYRPRLTTLIALTIVAAPIVLANLNLDERARGIFLPYPSYGWPLMWRWRNTYVFNGGATVLDENYSVARLTANLATWLVILAASGMACEWLQRRFRPRLRWSLRTILAAVGLLAVLCAWCAVLRDRANVQDPIISAVDDADDQGYYLYLERWGPRWLDLVGADRFRRRIVGADVHGYGDDDEEFLNRLGRLPGLRYLNLGPPPRSGGFLGPFSDDDLISPQCLAAVGKLVQLDELHLSGTIVGGSLAHYPCEACMAVLNENHSFNLSFVCRPA